MTILRLTREELIKSANVSDTSDDGDDTDGNLVDDPTEVNYEAQADSGEIEIISFENDIVTGTFSFTGVADNGDTITITEGEFTYEF